MFRLFKTLPETTEKNNRFALHVEPLEERRMLSVNLVTNGSFEANTLDGDAFTRLPAAEVTGWNSLNGQTIELWDSGHAGVNSADGSNHIELDNFGNAPLDGIYQDLQTTAGQTYEISFAMRTQRGGYDTDDNSVVVEWNGVKTKFDGYRASGNDIWTTHKILVVGTGSDRILFRESGSPGANDGSGPHLDAIFVGTPRSSISGKYFVDANRNGLKDAGEAGVAGAKVELYDDISFRIVDTTTTDSNGNYRFENVTPNNRMAIFFQNPSTIASLDSSYFFTGGNLGSNDAIDSDVRSQLGDGRGQTDRFPVRSGQLVTNVDAGAQGLTVSDQFNGTGFSQQTLASGLNQPIGFAVAPDGRIFVAEKAGEVKVVENGVVTSTFIDLKSEVNSQHDRGLIGIAIDPNFATNRRLYLQYTVELQPSNPDARVPAGGRLIRIEESANTPGVADLSTRVTIQDGHEGRDITHSVGDVDFDNDGNLIFTWGDGGFHQYLRLQTQDPNSVQGKIFRIDPDTLRGVVDNPFYNPANPTGTASRVWALGLRNPWRLNVDRGTGDVYIGEVTDFGPEEVNVIRADGSSTLNFGWPYYEGTNGTNYGTAPDGFIQSAPFIALPHTGETGGDAIVAGNVFRGSAYPEQYDGRYFFANFNQGILYTSDQSGNYQIFGTPGDYQGVVDIQMGPDGHIWLMNLFTGEISRLVNDSIGVANRAPIAAAELSQTAGAAPLSFVADGRRSTDPDGDSLTYSWDVGDNGTVDATGSTPSLSVSNVGRTPIRLTVFDGRGGSSSTLTEVTVRESPDLLNLAYGRPATQSGDANGGIASRAVDGSTNGNFSFNSVTQTNQTITPLWQVDLGGSKAIGNIEVFGRTDGGAGTGISDYWVLVSDTPFDTGNLDAARTTPGVTAIRVDGTSGNRDTVAVGTTGRYVRIQMESRNATMALAEVRVLAPTATVQSTLEVVARGTTGDEVLQLQIDGTTVREFDVTTGFSTYTYTTSEDISADRVRIQFANDLYDPADGIDRNLTVDKIRINGLAFESEDSVVYSTGTWNATDGIVSGFGRGDTLHSNGYFQYSGGGNQTNSTPIQIRARGSEGGERFSLQIDGVTVQTFTTTTSFQSFTYDAPAAITADRIMIVFADDEWDPVNGIDRNLTVDFITVASTRLEAEGPTTFSTGTWRAEDGIVEGLGRGDTLHSNGFFRFSI